MVNVVSIQVVVSIRTGPNRRSIQFIINVVVPIRAAPYGVPIQFICEYVVVHLLIFEIIKKCLNLEISLCTKK